MIRFFLGLLVVAHISALGAEEQLECSNIVADRLEAEAANSGDWEFEGMQKITLEQAVTMIESARWDSSSEADRKEAVRQAKLENRSHFAMHWTAPSNSGTSVLVVDTNSCKIVADIVHSSDE